MRVGFTGTRDGMNERQKIQLAFVLSWLAVASGASRPEFHHGDAVGADAQADVMAGVHYKVVKHPPRSATPKDLLARNEDIVAAADILIAAPRKSTEELRSGTWATVRYARSKGIPVVMLSR